MNGGRRFLHSILVKLHAIIFFLLLTPVPVHLGGGRGGADKLDLVCSSLRLLATEGAGRRRVEGIERRFHLAVEFVFEGQNG